MRTRVEYVYRSTEGGDLRPLADPAARPPDLARTRTALGRSVPYIVRLETGTVNRSIYQIAVLHDPSLPAPDFATRPNAWNGRLIYTFGGGCAGGWYHQGSSTGGVDDDVMLGLGYAVASASLNVFGNNCNDLLAAETMMMVKERFIEAFGPPRSTIGWGCSGGSYQALQIGDNYPGLLDGVVTGCSFPDVGHAAVTVHSFGARLLHHYFTAAASEKWTPAEQVAVSGLPDHTVNVYGRDPETGFARRILDNVGVQYGLAALNQGAISKAQFLDLNERIGGVDIDARFIPTRTVGDLEAIAVAYATGRVLSGGGGLAEMPIIDYRGYSDLMDGDPHQRFHSFSIRERLIQANGHANNHVMLVEDGATYGLFSTESPVVREALVQMDTWLYNLEGNRGSGVSARAAVVLSRPEDLVDACFDEAGEATVEPMTPRHVQLIQATVLGTLGPRSGVQHARRVRATTPPRPSAARNE